MRVLVLVLFSLKCFSTQTALSCTIPELEDWFKYYYAVLDSNKKNAELTYSYIYGGQFGQRLGYSYENAQKLKVNVSDTIENYYEWRHNLTYSTKVRINRVDPSKSLLWLDAQWNRFACKLVKLEEVKDKLEALKKEKIEKEKQNKF